MLYTKTATYLLPMVSRYINVDLGSLINVYLGDELHNRFNDYKHLYLHFKFNNSADALKYEDYLINNPYSEGHYDVDNDTYMIVFKIPAVESDLVSTFLEGKYSHFPLEYKNDIISFFKLKNSDKLFQVLFRDRKLKRKLEYELGVTISEESELSSPPLLEMELFKDSIPNTTFT